jgi:hypothetical protein
VDREARQCRLELVRPQGRLRGDVESVRLPSHHSGVAKRRPGARRSAEARVAIAEIEDDTRAGKLLARRFELQAGVCGSSCVSKGAPILE